MKKHILIGIGIAVCVLSAAIAFGIIRKKTTSVTRDQIPNAQTSLREKARQKGHYVGTVRPVETTKYDDVESLAKASALLVTGIVQQQKSSVPSTNERLIVTGHQLLVQEVLKGQVKTGDIITVETLGGSVQFEDGSVAEMKAPEVFKDPEMGKSYVFFLRPHKSAYRLVGGPQGLFEITPRGRIRPQVPAEDLLMLKYDKKNLQEFLDVIRKNQAVGLR